MLVATLQQAIEDLKPIVTSALASHNPTYKYNWAGPIAALLFIREAQIGSNRYLLSAFTTGDKLCFTIQQFGSPTHLLAITDTPAAIQGRVTTAIQSLNFA